MVSIFGAQSSISSAYLIITPIPLCYVTDIGGICSGSHVGLSCKICQGLCTGSHGTDNTGCDLCNWQVLYNAGTYYIMLWCYDVGGKLDEYIKTVGKWEGVLFLYLGAVHFLKNLATESNMMPPWPKSVNHIVNLEMKFLFPSQLLPTNLIAVTILSVTASSISSSVYNVQSTEHEKRLHFISKVLQMLEASIPFW